MPDFDALAERFADALAAPHMFWLGPDRRLPGDEPPNVKLDDLTGEAREIGEALTKLPLPEAPSADDVSPRAEAVRFVLQHRP